jgi:hypothetical protein
MAAFLLTPHRILPIRKTRMAIMATGLRPKTSDSLPQNGTEAALTRRYADPVQAYNEFGRWKSFDTVGRAVGRRTVSKATRDRQIVRAMKESSVAGGVFLDLDTVLVIIEPASEVMVESCLLGKMEEGCGGVDVDVCEEGVKLTVVVRLVVEDDMVNFLWRVNGQKY